MTRRVTMADAAQELGISKEAIRKRVQRGTLLSDMGEDGRRYVYLDAGPDAGRTGADAELGNNITEVDPRDELIATLKEQLEAERNAHAETRRIAYTLAQRVPHALEPPEAPHAPETPAEGTERVETPDRGEGSQEGTERRSWWRRFFGLE